MFRDSCSAKVCMYTSDGGCLLGSQQTTVSPDLGFRSQVARKSRRIPQETVKIPGGRPQSSNLVYYVCPRPVLYRRATLPLYHVTSRCSPNVRGPSIPMKHSGYLPIPTESPRYTWMVGASFYIHGIALTKVSGFKTPVCEDRRYRPYSKYPDTHQRILGEDFSLNML